MGEVSSLEQVKVASLEKVNTGAPDPSNIAAGTLTRTATRERDATEHGASRRGEAP